MAGERTLEAGISLASIVNKGSMSKCRNMHYVITYQPVSNYLIPLNPTAELPIDSQRKVLLVIDLTMCLRPMLLSATDLTIDS